MARSNFTERLQEIQGDFGFKLSQLPVAKGVHEARLFLPHTCAEGDGRCGGVTVDRREWEIGLRLQYEVDDEL